jgi:hypothetical protein
MFEDLTKENYIMFAMRWYTNPHCTDILEFKDDLKRIRYINRLFYKYKKTGELRERLILNHLVVLYNMFDARAMTRMLVMQCWEYMSYLKPFLIFLNYWTTDIGRVNGKTVVDSEISLDTKIIETLRQI